MQTCAYVNKAVACNTGDLQVMSPDLPEKGSRVISDR